MAHDNPVVELALVGKAVDDGGDGFKREQIPVVVGVGGVVVAVSVAGKKHRHLLIVVAEELLPVHARPAQDKVQAPVVPRVRRQVELGHGGGVRGGPGQRARPGDKETHDPRGTHLSLSFFHCEKMEVLQYSQFQVVYCTDYVTIAP